MNINNKIFCTLFVILLAGCSEKSALSIPSVSFDVDKAELMNMSEFIDSISVIPLETNDCSLLKYPELLSLTPTEFLVRDKGALLAFNREGRFLYSTQHLQGAGPNNYYSGLDFTLMENGVIEVFDAIKYKLIMYDMNFNYLSSHILSKDIFPSIGYLYISNDLRLFIGRNKLMLYSIKKKTIVNSVDVLYHPHMRILKRGGFRVENNEIYCSGNYQNKMYRIMLDDFVLQPYFEFDFGKNNFQMEDIQDNMPDKYYKDYIYTQKDKVFISDKYVDKEKKMCFFTYNMKSYFAYRDENKDITQIYYNEPQAKKQFLPASYYDDEIFYYICEPQYLEYVIDESLMSEGDISKMEKIKDDDNPIIVCYKLK